MLIQPIQHTAQIDLAEANAALICWGHRMGPCNRPNGDTRAHGLFVHGEMRAVAVTASLILPNTVAGLNRDTAIELARLCAAAPDINRVMLRVWREWIFPAFGHPWAISYQDEALHCGDTYRFDGWVRIGRSRSGTDTRSGRKGRTKTVWGWHADRAERHRLGQTEQRKESPHA